MNPTMNTSNIYERGNDYDQSTIWSKSPCGPYVTIEMLNAIISKLITQINQKQDKLNLGYIEYEGDKYLHDVNDKDIFAEVANNAINDENGENINDTYLKKADQTYQYNDYNEIVGINNSAIAAGQGSKRLVGENGIYVYDDLTANIIGISAKYAYASALSGYQTKLTDEQMIDIESIPFKLDKTEFNETISSYATKEYVDNKIADIGTPLVIRGSKTCAEIEALDEPKIGDVYCVEDTGIIHQPDYEDLNVNVKDEVAFTSDNGWIVVGREVAVDLSDYYKKNETSGASQISAALDAVDQQFSNYYPTSSTSGAAQISAALENKVDIDTLYDYYPKTETSSKDELNTAFANKANVSSLTAYITNTELANNYYDKTETSSKEQISAALETKADASELDLYYTMAETSGSDQLSAEFENKLDTSKLEIKDGKITAYDGTPFAGQGDIPLTGDVQRALDEVYTNSGEWLTVDDLSGYATEDEVAEVYDFVDSRLDDKLDVTAIEVTNNTITAINGSAIIDTTYTPGANIDITNNIISGKDWSGEIESSVSELAEEMASGFAGIDDELSAKLDVVDFYNELSGIDEQFEGIYDTLTEKQDALTPEQLSAISSVSSIKGTVLTGDSNIRATSAEEGNNIKWTLELTAQPVVTDTTLSGYRGLVASKDSTVSSQWNVGLEEPIYNYISNVSAISTITKSDIDAIWNEVTGAGL